MRTLFLALLLAIPLTEIGLFILVGERIGVLATLLLCILTAVFGIILVRRQGLGLLARARTDLEEGRAPTGAAAEGALIALAGLLLITPGFLTDVIGFALLIPALRRFALAQMGQHFAHRFGGTGTRPRAPGDGTIIDGEASEIHPDAKSLGSPWRR